MISKGWLWLWLLLWLLSSKFAVLFLDGREGVDEEGGAATIVAAAAAAAVVLEVASSAITLVRKHTVQRSFLAVAVAVPRTLWPSHVFEFERPAGVVVSKLFDDHNADDHNDASPCSAATTATAADAAHTIPDSIMPVANPV